MRRAVWIWAWLTAADLALTVAWLAAIPVTKACSALPEWSVLGYLLRGL